MAEEQDDSQKTEDPTRKRLEEALNKGQVAFSREISSFMLLLSLAFIISWMAAPMMKKAYIMLRVFIERPHGLMVDRQALGGLFADTLLGAASILLIPLLAALIAALAAGFMQNQLAFSITPITPELSRISPMSGLKRLFSLRSLIEFIKGIIKIVVVGVAVYLVVKPSFPRLRQLPETDFAGILDFIRDEAIAIMIAVCIIMFFVALTDYMYQRYEFIKGLRMSKQEIKDEYKQQEGDPIVKQRLRSLRMERARKRMMANVPSADVVITNPTHYAVALKYEQGVMGAPRLVAKGLDNIAMRIRELAKENDIPIVENPPLAQALYQAVEIDEEIPFQYYKAVAEIIGYVYRLKGKLRR